jgi:hypothetical protein
LRKYGARQDAQDAVHNIQPDVPVENILAMYEQAREYRPSFA